MDLSNYLESIGAPNHQLAMRDLKPLSDLDPGERSIFLKGWNAIPSPRRIEIMRAMVELAEDNVDLLFQRAMQWCLDDPDSAVRAAAIEGLWESDSPSVMRRMLELLRTDMSIEVREAAATGLSRFAYQAELGELDDADAELLRKSLLAMVRDQNQPLDVRRRALESAGYFASEADVLLQIERAYTATEQELRESALVAMGRSMLPRWLPTIARELESRSPALRYEAARAAGEMADEGRPLVARVARLLGDSDTEVALAAIWALGQIGGEAARRVLREASKSESEARIQAANEALAELSIEDGLMGAEPSRIGPRGGINN
jgi:HEAT repeat protein